MASRSSAIQAARGKSSARASVLLRRGHPAVLLTVTVGALLLLGLIMILSASSVSSFATYGSSFMFFKRQLIWAAIGVVSWKTVLMVPL